MVVKGIQEKEGLEAMRRRRRVVIRITIEKLCSDYERFQPVVAGALKDHAKYLLTHNVHATGCQQIKNGAMLTWTHTMAPFKKLKRKAVIS